MLIQCNDDRYALYGSATVLVISVGQGVRDIIIDLVIILITIIIKIFIQYCWASSFLSSRSSLLTSSSSWNYLNVTSIVIKSPEGHHCHIYTGDWVHSWRTVPVPPFQVKLTTLMGIMMTGITIRRVGGDDHNCYRQDLEVSEEGSYFSLKGSPRSEFNPQRAFSPTWSDLAISTRMHRKWKLWILNYYSDFNIWIHRKWKWGGIISGSWLRAALDQLVPEENKVRALISMVKSTWLKSKW